MKNKTIFQIIRADCRAIFKNCKRTYKRIGRFLKRRAWPGIKLVLKYTSLGMKIILKLSIRQIIRALKFVDKKIVLKL